MRLHRPTRAPTRHGTFDPTTDTAPKKKGKATIATGGQKLTTVVQL